MTCEYLLSTTSPTAAIDAPAATWQNGVRSREQPCGCVGSLPDEGRLVHPTVCTDALAIWLGARGLCIPCSGRCGYS